MAKLPVPASIKKHARHALSHKYARGCVRVVKRTWHKFHPRLTKKNLLLLGGGAGVFLVLLYGAVFYWPRSAVFSFGGNNCITTPVLLPNFISSHNGETLAAEVQPGIKIAGYPVYSGTTCISAHKMPREQTVDTIVFGSQLFKKDIRVSVQAFPKLASQDMLAKPVITQEPLAIELNSADRVFKYRLYVDKHQIDCTKQNATIGCDVPSLKLKQSKRYTFRLERLFRGAPSGTVFEESLRTVKNIRVIDSSIKPGQTVYDKPKGFSLKLSREAVSREGAGLSAIIKNKRETIAFTTKLTGKKLAIYPAKPLPRDATIEFRVRRISASDGGFLAKPYTLSFKTSGGPKVRGISIGTYRAPTVGSIVINFDTAVLAAQKLQNYIRVSAGGRVLAASVQAQGSSVVITPTTSLPRCKPIAINVSDGIQSTHGIAGGSAWQYNSRTICQNVFSIGTSVQGRSITGYSFGSGPSTVLYVGSTHGNETSSSAVLMQWIDALEARGAVPKNRTIVVIPVVNPDGYAIGQRTNAHNVDLNRNFPANNWKSSVKMPNGTTNPKGGGTAPLSEPESSALARYTLSVRPRLVLTYHAKAGTVIPNGSGDSGPLARRYDDNSNVYYASNSTADSIFQYDTTGAYEDWLRDKAGIPALLIELWTISGYEFSGHQNAMWSMVNLP